MLSMVVSLEYLRIGELRYLRNLSRLLGLLWLQFRFAGLFHTLRKEEGRRAVRLLLIILVPTPLLFAANLAMVLVNGQVCAYSLAVKGL